MSLETDLERVAAQYRAEGYQVVVRPGDDLLPTFAAGFRPDLLATRGAEGVLVRVKRDRSDLEADPDVSRQAEVTNAQHGWRYDLVVLSGETPLHRALRDGSEPTVEQIEAMLEEAETLCAGTPRAGFVLAWAGLEAAMRRAAQRAGIGGAPGTFLSTLIRELYAAGWLSLEDFRRLDRLRHARLLSTVWRRALLTQQRSSP
jgi:hypothetical protein